MNFLFISPNFPTIYSHFVKELNYKGVNVFGIGDTPYENLNDELRDNLKYYCYVSDLSNIEWMKNAISYLISQYGEMDYLESNNEYWLESDAKLREIFNIKNGLYPIDMDKIKYKSKMKEYFKKAGAKVARYILVDNLDQCLEFVKEVGYPVFAKPDNGVGAASTFKIDNEEQLINFINTPKNTQYIMEEYLDGYIISFDGVCNDNSEVILAFNEVFPTPIADVVRNGLDVYYYAKLDMDKDFKELGKKVVKSFGIRKRCFHIEFFVLKNEKKGLGKKGDIIALEVNMRSPGGDTPDLLSLALDKSYYEVYADVIVNNKTSVKLDDKHYIALSVSRRNKNNYQYNDDEIKNMFQNNLKRYGTYPPTIAGAMGDRFFFLTFDDVKEVTNAVQIILNKY